METHNGRQAQAEPDTKHCHEKGNQDERQPELLSAQHVIQDRAIGSNPRDLNPPEQLPDTAPTDLKSAPTTRQELISVSRSNRRGLFASCVIIAEAEDPYLYSQSIKWFITFVVAFAAAATSLGGAILYPALTETAQDLNASATVTNLSIALYMLSISFSPLWWSSFSETAGRRTTYISSLILFVLFATLSAFAKSIGVFVAMRMLSGGAGASVQAVGAGTLADIWEPRERGKAMGRFYIGPLCGPLFAPIIGGFLAARWGWRSTQWFLMVYGGISFILVLFALPETLAVSRIVVEADAQEGNDNAIPGRDGSPHISQTRVRIKIFLGALRRLFVDPLKITLLLQHLPIFFTAYYAALAFGTFYIVNISVQNIFAKPPYSFSVSQVGLIYLPSGCGFLISALFSGRWADKVMAREARRQNRYDDNGIPILRPEDRMMENGWVAAIALPISLVWYGWTADKGVFWVVPMLATLVFGLSAMLIFNLVVTMLTEFVPRKPSSGVAVANFLRNIFSCIGTVLGDPLIRVEGNGWVFTGLGILVSTGPIVIWWMRAKGAAWQEANKGKIK